MVPTTALRTSQLVGVVRAPSATSAESIASGLVDGGMKAIEITTGTPGVFDVLERLIPRHPDVCWGIGTVRTRMHVVRSTDVGAAFIVSPHTDPHLIDGAKDRGLAVIAGALTPTEVLAAHDAGADFVKVFPISSGGGPAYVRWLRGPIPDVPLWVSGDVAVDDIAQFLSAGATLIGLTSALTGGLGADPRAEAAERAQAALRRAQTLPSSSTVEVIGDQRVRISVEALAAAPRHDLATLLPGRGGRVVRLEPWLVEARMPRGMVCRVTSDDGFEREISSDLLVRGGYLMFERNGIPLTAAEGGPFRLFVVDHDDPCINVKGLARIEAASEV